MDYQVRMIRGSWPLGLWRYICPVPPFSPLFSGYLRLAALLHSFPPCFCRATGCWAGEPANTDRYFPPATKMDYYSMDMCCHRHHIQDCKSPAQLPKEAGLPSHQLSMSKQRPSNLHSQQEFHVMCAQVMLRQHWPKRDLRGREDGSVDRVWDYSGNPSPTSMVAHL